MENLYKLEKILEYSFKNKELLKNALIHRSYTNEHRNETLKNNERLEFLGDAVLEIIVSDYLYKTSDKQEGELSRMRASIVCEQALSSWCYDNNLGEYLILGHGEDVSGGRNRPSVLSNALEAIIGAVYLDGGFDVAKKFITEKIIFSIISNEEYFIDSKTRLQEIIQEKSDIKLSYELLNESGPDHDKTYTIRILFNTTPISIGVGSSKKAAQQEAAKNALELIDNNKSIQKFWQDIRKEKYVSKRS